MNAHDPASLPARDALPERFRGLRVEQVPDEPEAAAAQKYVAAVRSLGFNLLVLPDRASSRPYAEIARQLGLAVTSNTDFRDESCTHVTAPAQRDVEALRHGEAVRRRRVLEARARGGNVLVSDRGWAAPGQPLGADPYAVRTWCGETCLWTRGAISAAAGGEHHITCGIDRQAGAPPEDDHVRWQLVAPDGPLAEGRLPAPASRPGELDRLALRMPAVEQPTVLRLVCRLERHPAVRCLASFVVYPTVQFPPRMTGGVTVADGPPANLEALLARGEHLLVLRAAPPDGLVPLDPACEVLRADAGLVPVDDLAPVELLWDWLAQPALRATEGTKVLLGTADTGWLVETQAGRGRLVCSPLPLLDLAPRDPLVAWLLAQLVRTLSEGYRLAQPVEMTPAACARWLGLKSGQS